MNIRLLSKLRKIAHNSVRVVPEGDGCRVEYLDLDSRNWYPVLNGYFNFNRIVYKSDMKDLENLLTRKRKEAFNKLANDALYDRRKKRLSKL